MSPPGTVRRDIRAALPGASEMTSQVDRLNSNETKIELCCVLMVA